MPWVVCDECNGTRQNALGLPCAKCGSTGKLRMRAAADESAAPWWRDADKLTKVLGAVALIVTTLVGAVNSWRAAGRAQEAAGAATAAVEHSAANGEAIRDVKRDVRAALPAKLPQTAPKD